MKFLKALQYLMEFLIDWLTDWLPACLKPSDKHKSIMANRVTNAIMNKATGLMFSLLDIASS